MMAVGVKAGEGYVDIVPEMRGFQERVGREVEQATSKAAKRADSAIRMGTRLTAGVTLPVAAALGGAVSLASDLQQSVGAVESVFGDASDKIFDFGETSAESFGLARQEVNQLGAVVGAQLKGMGFSADEAAEQTVNLQERAADLAATYGGTTAEAIQAISSLLRGERDPIEKYGVSLKQVDINARIASEGMDTSTVAAQKQSEATAALQLLMKGTADAAGQFAREEDTLAGQMARGEATFKDAAAALGTELLPVMTDAIGLAKSAVDVYTALPDEVQTGILVLAGVAAAIGPISVAAGAATKGIIGLRKATVALRTARAAAAAANVAEGYSAIGASAAGAIPSVRGVAKGIGLIGAGAGATLFGISAAADALNDAMRGPAAQADELTLALEGIAQNGRVPDSVIESFDGLGDSIGRIADRSFGDIGQSLLPDWAQHRPFANATAEVEAFDQALAQAAASGESEVLAAGMDILRDKADELGIPLQQLIDEHFPEYAQAADAAAIASEKEADAQRDGAEATEENTEAHEDQVPAIEAAKEAHDAYTDSLRAAADPIFALNKAFEGVDEAQRAYTEAVEEHGRESEQARSAALDLAAATSEAEQAAIDGDLSFQAFEGKLRDWVNQGVLTADQADAMRERVAELRGESENYTGTYTAFMEARTDDARRSIQNLRRQLGDLTGRKYEIVIDQRLGATVSTGSGGRLVEGRAHGGPTAANTPYWVGEEGPELFVPDAAGRVVSHDDSIRQMADQIAKSMERNGGTVIENMHVTAWSGPFDLDQLTREIEHKMMMKNRG